MKAATTSENLGDREKGEGVIFSPFYMAVQHTFSGPGGGGVS